MLSLPGKQQKYQRKDDLISNIRPSVVRMNEVIHSLIQLSAVVVVVVDFSKSRSGANFIKLTCDVVAGDNSS